MTEEFYKKLGLSACTISNTIMGINNSLPTINKRTVVSITSMNDNFKANIKCFILNSITDNVPSSHVNLVGLKIP